jgi:hypothetical protein
MQMTVSDQSVGWLPWIILTTGQPSIRKLVCVLPSTHSTSDPKYESLFVLSVIVVRRDERWGMLQILPPTFWHLEPGMTISSAARNPIVGSVINMSL